MKVSVFRKEHFNAAHRLFNAAWSDEKNQEVFGKCSNPRYHGHNYEMVVEIRGNVNQDTGYVIDLGVLSRLIQKHILNDFDHRNLNEEVSEFQKLIPTAENIAIVIWNRLRPVIDKNLELSITLYETERNFVRYPG
jgi:6-pyruvoyltetrahydropterin/6-carboxytetrahydropterin synthase